MTFRIKPEAGRRLDKALAASVPEAEALSRSRLARLINEGAVRVDGKVVTDQKANVPAGAEISIALPEAAEVTTLPEPMALSILYEDDDLLVVDKPAGLVVHPAPGTPSGTLVNGLLAHLGGSLSGVGGEKRPGIVHRIDKDTSGLLVVAKSDRAHHGLSQQFANHTVTRRYTALCHGVPDVSDARLGGLRGVRFEGARLKISTALARHRTDRQRQAVVWSEAGRHAVTRLRMEEAFGAVARISAELETGRTHQIRVHARYIGHPLIGDATYGGRRKVSAKAVGDERAARLNTFPRQALHAETLGFQHPVSGQDLAFRAPIPADMTALLELLRGI